MTAPRLARLAVITLPVLVAARPLGNPRYALTRFPVPPAHAVDVWLGDGVPGGGDVPIGRLPELPGVLGPVRNASAAVGGFEVVGSVAVLEGDDATVVRAGTGFGVTGTTLAAVSRRFLSAFGDDYDQIAVFLTFDDRTDTRSLAYQLPVKNDVRGIGLGLFDQTDTFGSKGRMQTVLNMKRITVYGRDAADDPDNGLYAVWAQEAAHRWLVYLNYKRPQDDKDSDALRGRQKAHWARHVQADGSIMDGYLWRDNGDGTYTPVERGKRYGALDQYAMGLRAANEVPAFFALDNITDEEGRPVTTGVLSRSARYKATRVDLTIDDIIRAVGRREPATDAAARDLRMGVVLLGAPGVPVATLGGEAARIDQTRRLWTEFYNTAGGGRGKVCTELHRPCRGEAFSYGEPELVEAGTGPGGDGTVGPGEPFTVRVAVTNVGSEAGKAKVRIAARTALSFQPDTVESASLAPGASATLTFQARPAGGPCARPVTLDFSAPGRLGPSKGSGDVVLGLAPRKVDSFEDAGAAAAWRVDPDGTDTATRGRWALGTPARTAAFDVTLQPGAAYSGSQAFVTGLAGDETDNVDGRTTLESPPYALAGVREPHLSYRVYFVSADFEREILVPAAAGSLKVEASFDEGPWVEVDRLTGLGTSWQRRLVRLSEKREPGAPGAAEVRFRFVADEQEGSARPAVEVVIDDVGIFEEVAACEGATAGDTPPAPDGAPAEGCACRVGAHRRAGAGPLLGFGLLALGLMRGLQRRRGRGRR